MLKVQCPLEVSSWSFKCKLKTFEIIIYGNFQLNLQMMFLGLHLSNREDVEYYEIISTINFSIQFFVELTSACWPRTWVVHLSDTKVICLIVPHLSHIYCEQIECSKGKLQPKVSPPNLFSELDTTVIFTIPAPCIGPRSLSVFSPDK